jgi:hypothetical protein
VTIAVVDLPYTVVRRHVRQGTGVAAHRDLLARTVRAVLT